VAKPSVLVAICFTVISAGTAASAQSARTVTSAAMCKALQTSDFTTIQDAPTQVTATNWVEADDKAPAYCHVLGYITTSIGIEIRLPATIWNGKFLEVGCGGFCGTTGFIHLCDGPLRKGYACIATDMGHQSTTQKALWAYNNLQAEIDHSYRAAHVAALAGKAIVENYYSQAPNKAYFIGCSTGGRQAMVEAQRFPWDFDGIIAAAPSLSVTGVHMDFLWGNRTLRGRDGHSIVTDADLKIVQDAVLAKCDMDDGVKDGLVSNPEACKFDPSELLCNAGTSNGCLTAEKVDVLRKVYSGPMTSTGLRIYPGGVFPGSEFHIMELYMGSDRDPIYKFVGEEFRYSGFQPNPGPSWRPEDFDFDRDYKRLGMMDGLSDAINPDLRKFKSRGGKLIAYMGWSDSQVPKVIDYYKTTERTMGGRRATQDFFRLFMVPGMKHCTWGNGAFAIDSLSYLETWVERDKAPAVMVGAHVTDLDWVQAFFLKYPLDPDTPIAFTRPVYPYPLHAKYNGHGDPNSAANFGPVGSP
jgi:Tannase and feruloyl esterase